MRLISVTVLILLLLSQPLGMTWIYVSFKLNQAIIAKDLCVQKNIKGNKCQGCCQLKKQLKNSDQTEQKELPKSQRIKGESPYYNRLLHSRDNSIIPQQKEETYFTRNTWVENLFVIVEIFHPPKISGPRA